MKKYIHLSVLLIGFLIVSCKQEVKEDKEVVVEEKASETSAQPDKA
jgi:hypothetical protein